ncbi:MAG: ATP-binding cassette domain-containing protein [Bacillota bacterium]|nr:ATP-binding cassette domain-containing protein [Bacillota bacterium]
MKRIIEIGCISHCYPDSTEVQICGMDFVMHAGERVALLGSNGSGKTTLLSHITGLLSPTVGSVKVFDVDPRKQFKQIRHRLGIVLQAPEEQIIGPTVWDDVAFSLLNAGWSQERVENRVEEVLTELKILKLANKIPHYLSGGEQQKVALAGALALQPDLLVLDEPLSKLDQRGKTDLVCTLNSLNKKYGTAIVFTVHELSKLAEMADTVYVIKEGRFIAKGKPMEIITNLSILQEAGLEAPPLLQLIRLLNKKGLDIPSTLDYEKLAEYISMHMRVIS